MRDIEFSVLTEHGLTSVSELDAWLGEVREQGSANIDGCAG